MDEKLLIEIRDSLKKIEGLLMEPPRCKLNPSIHYHYCTTVDTSPECVCGTRISGSSSGGWFCPVHGQVF